MGRDTDVSNYSLDVNGVVIKEESRRKICTAHSYDNTYVPVARRTLPIDKYSIPSELVTSPLVTSLRILKLPLLGQAGFAYFWCGRTSAAMIYNWYKLIGGAGSGAYISHWDAGKPGFRLNLRLADRTRAFTYPTDTLVGGSPVDSDSIVDATDGKTKSVLCGPFGDRLTGALKEVNSGAKFEETPLMPYSPLGREEEGKRIAASEKLVREKFAKVIASIDANNPVHFDTGLTTGCNHFIVIAGYATIVDKKGVERLWLAIANPAGPEPFLNSIDLAKQGLGAVGDDTNGIVLVPGAWDSGRAELHLIRASFFFLPKRLVFEGKSKPDDWTKYTSKNALVLDDVGNPQHEGGGLILCTTPTKASNDDVLTKEHHCAFPLTVPGVSECPIPALYLEESRNEDAGGFYPLGYFDNLHGGVHFPTFDAVGAADGLVAVQAIAPGRVVAARLHGGGAADVPDDHDTDEQLKTIGLAREVVGNSPNFVLVRHELKELDPPGDKPIVFYSLCMHLAEPDKESTKAPYGNVRWLGELNRRRLGSLVVVDPTLGRGTGAATLTQEGVAISAELGDHLWPAEKPPEPLISKGGLASYTSGKEVKRVPLEITPNADDARVVLAAKNPESDLLEAVKALDAGGVVTFPEPHQATFVDAGTIVGYAAKTSHLAHGFVHWEILAPSGAESGVKKLVELVEKHLGIEFDKWAETVANNKLEDSERVKLEGLLPEPDRKYADVLAHQSFARPHGFASGAAGGELERDHYLMKITGKAFHDKCLPAGRSQKIKLYFRGLGQLPEDKTLELDFSAALPSVVVQVPAWASWVDVSADGYLVRETNLSRIYEDPDRRKSALADHEKELASHIESIAECRWRNLQMTHLNEWSANEMKNALGTRYNERGGAIRRSVEALAWWGAKETPAFSVGTGKLFGTPAMPADAKLDNVNPIMALWLVNVLLDRGKATFVTPEASAPEQKSSALYAGWLPATPERKPQRVGDPVRVLVIRDRERGACKVAVEAVETTGKVPKPIPIGREGDYSNDTFEVGDYFSAWGSFSLKVRHGNADQGGAVALGKPILDILEPKPAGSTAPIRNAAGRYRWDLSFSDNCPARLKGYVFLRAKPQGAPDDDFKVVNLALPVEAVEIAGDPAQARFLGPWMVTPPPNEKTEVASGVPWSMIKLGCEGEPPKRIARALLDAIAKLQSTFKKAPIALVKGSVEASGCAASIQALAKDGNTAAKNNVGLADAAKALVGGLLQAADAVGDAAAPTAIRIRVAELEFDETPGGQMRVEFDPKALFGAALALLKPEAKKEIDVQLGLRFLDGGHILPGSDSSKDEFEHRDVDWAKAAAGIPAFDFLSPGVDATLARPALGDVTLTRESSGTVVRAALVGGNADFWKAAGMVMKVEGKEKNVSGPNELRAAFVYAGPKAELAGKKFKVEITNKNAASYHGAEFARDSLQWTSPEIDGVPAVSHVTASPVSLEGDSKMLEVALTADVTGISAPWTVRVWVVDGAGKRVPVAVKPSEAIAPDGAGKVSAKLVFKYAELAKRYHEATTFTVWVGRQAGGEKNAWPSCDAKDKCELTFVPKPAPAGH